MTEDYIPQTIQEMKEWYAYCGFPSEETTRFFIGRNYQKPRAFGIYQEDGVFIVYKNKDDGTRAIRYKGTDEAFAVRELYDRLIKEVDNQRVHGQDVVPRVHTGASGNGVKMDPGLKAGFIFFLVLSLIAGCRACSVALDKKVQEHNKSRRHYKTAQSYMAEERYLEALSELEYCDPGPKIEKARETCVQMLLPETTALVEANKFSKARDRLILAKKYDSESKELYEYCEALINGTYYIVDGVVYFYQNGTAFVREEQETTAPETDFLGNPYHLPPVFAYRALQPTPEFLRDRGRDAFAVNANSEGWCAEYEYGYCNGVADTEGGTKDDIEFKKGSGNSDNGRGDGNGTSGTTTDTGSGWDSGWDSGSTDFGSDW